MTDQPPVSVALSLGSNMGNRLLHLRNATAALAPYVMVTAASPAYEIAAADVAGQPTFLNAAIVGTTLLQPLALLWNLKDIENEMGRMPTFRYGPRLIDIDIIFYGSQIIDLPELTIPHKRLAERDFVLRPLCDIAPDRVHPQTGFTVAEMLARLPPQNQPQLGALL